MSTAFNNVEKLPQIQTEESLKKHTFLFFHYLISLLKIVLRKKWNAYFLNNQITKCNLNL